MEVYCVMDENDVLYDIFEDYEDAQNCIDAGGFVEDDLHVVAWEVREN